MMRKQISVLLLIVLSIAFNQSAFGVKAYPYPVEITQPDGTKLTVILRGDEHTKWAQTVDGYSILRNGKGLFEYAVLDSRNDMIPSGILAKDQGKRSANEIQFLGKVNKGLLYSKSQVGMMKSISKIYQKSSQKAFPTTGNRKLVCILIGFADKAFTKTKSDFDNLFNQIGYSADAATGSVYDYYKESSFGQLNLTVTVAGPYTASQNMAYYGGNDASGNDKNPQALVTEAVTLANPTVNYADFDNDLDGTVDGVYVIYAGYGEEAGASVDAIWAHAWAISPLTLDGKTVSSYSCSAELRGPGPSSTGITRIGVICHEFGHVMGASDFYDTDWDGTPGTGYDGTGDWDLMASGSWNNNGATPAHHNPYTIIHDYGWATATTLTSGTNITLTNAEQNSNSFYRVNTTTANEYFLIENRQKILFDSALPGHGMVIYHVDGSYISTAGNGINMSTHQGMYPVCASATGNPTATYGVINDAGLPYPGTSANTSFTDGSTPNAHSWAGSNTNKPITNIIENTIDKTVLFTFMGGVTCTMPTTQATLISTSAITSNSMTIGWTRGSGDNVIVVAKEGSAVDSDPTNGTAYTANSVFSSGSQVATNIYVVYSGTGNSVAVSGLKSGTTYYYSVYEYTSATSCYLTPGLTVSASTSCSNINTFPFTEDFESGAISACWSENIVSSLTHWQVLKGNGDTNPSAAHGGLNNLCFKNTSYTPSVTKLVLPSINLSLLTTPTLHFWHTQALWTPDQDELRIYYKTSAGGSWTLLASYLGDIPNWTLENIILPNPSADYYIAFEGTAKYGYGVCVDDISISNVTGIKDNEIAKANFLGQNHPNPFRQSTTIEFKLEKAGHVYLSVYNTLGREVDVIANEFLPAGSYSRTWTPKGIPDGIYFYQLRVDGLKMTKRLIKN
jgi:M6 family metalloprotease-like protein